MNIGKFVDLGESRTTTVEPKSQGEPSAKKTIKEYSRVSFDASDFPELSKKQVGSECVLVIKVKKVGERQPDSWDKQMGRKSNRIEVELIAGAEPTESKNDKGGHVRDVAGDGY